MRIGALLCGMVAGLLVFSAPFWGDFDLMQAFLALWPDAAGQRSAAFLAWYAVPAAAFAGGVLAVLTPGFAALLLFGAATAWVAIGSQLPVVFSYPLVFSPALAGFGAVLAFLAGELQLGRQRAMRRSRRKQAFVPALDAEAKAREEALRMDPQVVPRNFSPVRPVAEIEFTIEDQEPDLPRQPKQQVPWPEAAPEQRRPLVEERRPPRERHNGSLVPWLVGANGVALVGLAIAIGFLMVGNGQLAAPLGRGETVAIETALPPPPVVAEASPVRPTTPEETSLPLPSKAGPAAISLPMATGVPAALSSSEVAVGAPDAATDTSFDDPFAYCGAVGTVDYVDRRYNGPRFTIDIAEALRIPMNSAPDRVSWRCVDGVVYACASFDWPICDMTPTANEMVEFCKRNPNVPRLLAPNGTWVCENGRPALPEGASWPVDARGFYPPGWIPVVARPATPAAG